MRSPGRSVLLVVALSAFAAACADGSADGSDDVEATTASPSTTAAPESELAELVDVDPWIVYQGPASDGADGVMLVHPDGTGAHEIGGDVGAYGLPDWSPDGTRIVFTTRGGETEPLFEYDLTTEKSTQLFACDEPCLGYDEPSYARDGSSMIFIKALGPFVDDAPSDCGLWSGDVSTGEEARITSNASCDREYSPRLSPDGAQVAYYREGANEAGISTAIFVLDLASGEETQLTDWGTPSGYPDWSPDGEWITYTTYPLLHFNDSQFDSNLYRMRPDGSEVEQLLASTASLHPNQPRYTPDGEWISFTGVTPSARELWLIPAGGGEAVAVLTGGVHTHAAWQPRP
jgi:Tol biopolymer transport system component